MSNQNVIDAATALGKAIRESEAYDNFVTARAVAELDTQAYDLLMQYRKQEQKMHELMTHSAPDIHDLQRCMKALDEAKELLVTNETARIYVQTSAKMMSIVAQINETLGHFVDISPLMPKTREGCGNCGGDCGMH